MNLLLEFVSSIFQKLSDSDNLVRYAIENEHWDSSSTIDELISEATNSKITKIDNNFISQFIKKVCFYLKLIIRAF